MTEHVHEWQLKPKKGNYLEVAFCKICGVVVGASYIETILNEYNKLREATERLSAEDARVIADKHEGKTKEVLVAYADTLEGK